MSLPSISAQPGGVLNVRQGLQVNGLPVPGAPPGAGYVYAPTRTLYLDAGAPPGGDGSQARPWDTLAAAVAGAGTLAPGFYLVRAAPGDYPGTVTWPTAADGVVFALAGASQVATNFETVNVVGQNSPTTGDFFIANDVSFGTLNIDMSVNNFHVVNLVRCGLGNNGPPGLVVTPTAAPFSIMFFLNCGLNNATFNGNLTQAIDCGLGTIDVASGATLCLDGGAFLFGGTTVAPGGVLRTTGIIRVAPGAAPPHAAGPGARWETDGTSDHGSTGPFDKVSPSMYITGSAVAAPGPSVNTPLTLAGGSSGFTGFTPLKAGVYSVTVLVSNATTPGAPLPAGSSVHIVQGVSITPAFAYGGGAEATHIYTDVFTADADIGLLSYNAGPDDVHYRVTIVRLA